MNKTNTTKRLFVILFLGFFTSAFLTDCDRTIDAVGDTALKAGKGAGITITATAAKDLAEAKKIKDEAKAKILIDETTADIANDKLVYVALINYFNTMQDGKEKAKAADKLFKAQVKDNIRDNKLQIKRISDHYWKGAKTATIVIFGGILWFLLMVFLIKKFMPIKTNKTYSDKSFFSS